MSSDREIIVTPWVRNTAAEMKRATHVEARPYVPAIRAERLYVTVGMRWAEDVVRCYDYERGHIADVGERLLYAVVTDPERPHWGCWIIHVQSTDAAHEEARFYVARQLGLGEEVADDAADAGDARRDVAVAPD